MVLPLIIVKTYYVTAMAKIPTVSNNKKTRLKGKISPVSCVCVLTDFTKIKNTTISYGKCIKCGLGGTMRFLIELCYKLSRLRRICCTKYGKIFKNRIVKTSEKFRSIQVSVELDRFVMYFFQRQHKNLPFWTGSVFLILLY